jgi:hypothetical protein
MARCVSSWYVPPNPGASLSAVCASLVVRTVLCMRLLQVHANPHARRWNFTRYPAVPVLAVCLKSYKLNSLAQGVDVGGDDGPGRRRQSQLVRYVAWLGVLLRVTGMCIGTWSHAWSNYSILCSIPELQMLISTFLLFFFLRIPIIRALTSEFESFDQYWCTPWCTDQKIDS